MNPVAPGSKTSEYLLTVVNMFLGVVLSLVAVIHPGFHVDVDTQKWIVSLIVTQIGVVTGIYTHTRGKVKAASSQALPQTTVTNVVPAAKTTP